MSINILPFLFFIQNFKLFLVYQNLYLIFDRFLGFIPKCRLNGTFKTSTGLYPNGVTTN